MELVGSCCILQNNLRRTTILMELPCSFIKIVILRILFSQIYVRLQKSVLLKKNTNHWLDVVYWKQSPHYLQPYVLLHGNSVTWLSKKFQIFQIMEFPEFLLAYWPGTSYSFGALAILDWPIKIQKQFYTWAKNEHILILTRLSGKW